MKPGFFLLFSQYCGIIVQEAGDDGERNYTAPFPFFAPLPLPGIGMDIASSCKKR
jgi:hypothetical protein